MTPAQEAGLVIGASYRMKAGNSEGYPEGTLVKFTDDDMTSCPKFEVPKSCDDEGWNYIFLSDIEYEAVHTADVTFEDKQINVPIEITLITVKRKLTQAEREAITAIIDQ